MILTLLALFVVLIGVFCAIVYHQKGLEVFEGEGLFATALFSLIIGGACLLLCIGQISTREVFARSHIVKIEAIRETFKSARIDENIHPLELAAIQHKVAEKNEWIANAKFWTERSLTNWFWSKRILEIEPIR